MDKALIRAFLLWLEDSQTTENEILKRKADFTDAIPKVSSHEAKADIRLGLRLIDEELMSRLVLQRVSGKPR